MSDGIKVSHNIPKSMINGAVALFGAVVKQIPARWNHVAGRLKAIRTTDVRTRKEFDAMISVTASAPLTIMLTNATRLPIRMLICESSIATGRNFTNARAWRTLFSAFGAVASDLQSRYHDAKSTIPF
jgi:hypothetical protein